MGDGKSLVGTFPFNANADDHHHGHHEEHKERSASQSLAGRAQRQGGDDTDLVLELLLLLDLELMARDVLTKLRWLRRLNMTMLCSVTTPTTRGATPPTSPT